ncbi:putative HopJ type III effector protein [Vibrio nigripulchritudo MADA3029]|uniref:HopJ type III effector protein n=1 Tax=Vibrio nigripulchritudo TaxID=28173 RepID=UPI0003B21C33|nr:HopJ type III effector protein [Vibrio nigripulchritudo]CCN49712.1 putative HopJ type III effector protein [Vibrio nigripulchritudo MADA3020]CCN54001.1 putative HopJ type III effector protein [Vibrio nigripulchritudo MADA3021]CCN57424.1 putative HopJ type III effector protein [Vibrio nigripulchritudo MADA3029]
MELKELLTALSQSPETVQFQDVISVIDSNYEFTPTEFKNGDTVNEAGQNNGSCKIFAFAKLNQLDVQSALACFGDFYRKDVLENPEGEDHQNIRNFMRFGWDGIEFKGEALVAR